MYDPKVIRSLNAVLGEFETRFLLKHISDAIFEICRKNPAAALKDLEKGAKVSRGHTIPVPVDIDLLVLESLGLRSLGRNSDALQRSKAASQKARESYGDESVKLLFLDGHQAVLLRTNNRVAEARALFKDVIGRRKKLNYPRIHPLKDFVSRVKFSEFQKSLFSNITKIVSLEDAKGGSGTLIKFQSLGPLFLTAGHVLEKMPRGKGVQVMNGGKGRAEMPRVVDYDFVPERLQSKGAPDIGGVRLADLGALYPEKAFVDWNKLPRAEKQDVIDKPVLFAGFATSRGAYEDGFKKVDGLENPVLFYTLWPFFGHCIKADGEVAEVKYSSDGLIDPEGNKLPEKIMPAPDGLSGSLLFSQDLKVYGLIYNYDEPTKTIWALHHRNIDAFLQGYEPYKFCGSPTFPVTG